MRRRKSDFSRCAVRAPGMRQRCLHLESLEDRRLLAIDVSLTAGDVTFVAPAGDTDNDVLRLSADANGNLRHDLPLSGNLVSSIDLDAATPGEQSTSILGLSSLQVDLAGGTDRLAIHADTTLSFASASLVFQSDVVILDTPGLESLGVQRFVGSLLLERSVLLRSETGDVDIEGSTDALDNGQLGSTRSLTLDTPQGDNLVGGAVGAAENMMFLLEADFDADGDVDADDFSLWMTGMGLQSGATKMDGDADGDGDVDGDDFSIWQREQGLMSRPDPDGLASLRTDPSGASGTTHVGGPFMTTGNQTYAEAVVLTNHAVFTGSNVTFNGTIDGDGNRPWHFEVRSPGLTSLRGAVGSNAQLDDLITDAPGTVEISGGFVSTSNGQTYNDGVVIHEDVLFDAGNLTLNGTLDGGFDVTVNSPGITHFNGPVGSLDPLDSLTTDGAGSTDINGGTITTIDNQVYNDPVLLTDNTVLNGENVVFFASLDGDGTQPWSLLVNSPGITRFGSPVGAMHQLDALTTDAPGTTEIFGGFVSISNGQTHHDAVSIGFAATIDAGTLTFSSTVDSDATGPAELLINSPGVTTFGGPVGLTRPLNELITDEPGVTRLAGSHVITSGEQTYNDVITLAADVVIDAAALTVESTIDGDGSAARDLTINSAGPTLLKGSIGDTHPLGDLTTDGPGTTHLRGERVTTLGDQHFQDAVTIDDLTTLTGANVRFALAVDSDGSGPSDLTINSPGVTSFGTTVGVFDPLRNLVTDAPGTTELGGTVRTIADQTFQDAVVLIGNVVLVGANVMLDGTVDGDGNRPWGLGVFSPGVTRFGGAIGRSEQLEGLVTDAPGSTVLAGGFIATSAGQEFHDAVELQADTLILAGSLLFSASLDSGQNGARSLQVNSSGATTFGGPVGATQPLAEISTDAPGATVILGEQVVTTGEQIYGDPVTIGSDLVLRASVLTMRGAVDGDGNGPWDLSIESPGPTLFFGPIGDDAPLDDLATDRPGTTNLRGQRVTTVGDQHYGDAVMIDDPTILSGANVHFELAVNSDGSGPSDLTINSPGVTAFGTSVGVTDALRNLTTDALGTTWIGGTVNTGADQTYGDAVVFTGNAVLVGANVALGGTVDGDGNGPWGLGVFSPGITRFDGPVGQSAPLGGLVTDAPGSVVLGGGLITTLGAQAHHDVAVLGDDTVIQAGALTFASTLNSDANGTWSLHVSSPGQTMLLGAVGAVHPLNDLTTDAPGSTDINGESVTTAGDQSYADSVTLTDHTLLTGANVFFGQTVDSDDTQPWDLRINSPGTTVFDGAVGGIQPLHDLTTDGPGTTDLNGGRVTTTGDQDYQDPVVLTDNGLLAGTNVRFRQTVDGDATQPWSLEVHSPGMTRFDGAVGQSVQLDALVTDAPGTVHLRGGFISTSNGQTHHDNVILEANTLIDAGTLVFAAALDSDENGPWDLEINSPGDTVFDGPVGATRPLGDLTTDASGSTDINGQSITTSGDQTYNDTVILTEDAVLTGVNVSFATTVDSDNLGPWDLHVVGTGLTAFHGAVGATSALNNLTTDAPGVTDINGVVVNTEGDQTYHDAVELTAHTALSGANVTFDSTLDGDGNGPWDLMVASPGRTAFHGPVGSNTPLRNLTTDAPGQTDLNGSAVNTTLDQTYRDAVELTASAKLTGVNVRFNSTVDSDIVKPWGLEVVSSGVTRFGDNVGHTRPLDSLTTDAPGSTEIDSAFVTVVNDQTHHDAVVLGNDTLISAGSLSFHGVLDADGGARDLRINSPGTVAFHAPVGSMEPLDSLITDAPGITDINGESVTTTGEQRYGDAVVLTDHTALNAADLVFHSTIDGDGLGPWDLFANSPGNTVFEGAIGDEHPLRSFSTDGVGQTQIGGGILDTAGDQIHGDDVLLTADLVATSLGELTFLRTVDAADDAEADTSSHGLQVSRPGGASTSIFRMPVGADRQDPAPQNPSNPTTNAPSDADGLDFLIVTSNGPLEFVANVTTTREISIAVLESASAGSGDDLFIRSGVTIANSTAPVDVTLEAGDDILIESMASVMAAGALHISGDANSNDAPGTTIDFTSGGGAADASGIISGAAGVFVTGGSDADRFLLQAERLSAGDAHVVRGYRSASVNSGEDTFDVFFAADSRISMAAGTSLTLDGGAGGSERDSTTLHYDQDQSARRVQLQYTSVRGDASLVGNLGTHSPAGALSSFAMLGMEDYVFLAGSAQPDHLVVRALEEDTTGTTIEVNDADLSQRGVALAPVRIAIGNIECLHLVGSDGDDRVTNNTNVPSLIEGRDGNDLLEGGSNVDVIFAGGGADQIFGRPDIDFLFADVSLVNQDGVLTGIAQLDESGQSDLLDGGGSINHGAQLGPLDIVRNISGMLVDGGGQKNVTTWLRAQFMVFDLNAATNMSDAVNMLIQGAFFADALATGKIGITTVTACNFLPDIAPAAAGSGALAVEVSDTKRSLAAAAKDLAIAEMDQRFIRRAAFRPLRRAVGPGW